jgi:hypothetical protein
MDWDLGKGSILLGQEEKTLGRKCNLRWKPQPRPDRGVPWRMATKTAAGQITGTELSWTGNTRLFTTNWALRCLRGVGRHTGPHGAFGSIYTQVPFLGKAASARTQN